MPLMTTAGAVEGVAKDGVTAFYGIPFAASTAGDGRWRPPSAPKPWRGVRTADAFGPVCPQNLTSWPASEDCLNLNVWTPNTSAHMPVLVWIFGGRFVWGSGRDPQFDGAALAAMGVVVVTFNYRLGVFGWLAAPGGASGDYGLLDQLAALNWVQDNIAAFGGDPGRVTIAGQSAGAASVLILVGSSQAQGLFHGAMALSGAAHPGDPGLWSRAGSYRDLATAQRQGTQYLAEHGASSIDQARRLPASQLLAGNDADDPSVDQPHRPPLFRPVLGGSVMAVSYDQMLTAGAANDVPIITGTTRDEDGASPNPSVTLAQWRATAQRTYRELADEFLALYPATNDAEAAAMSNQAANDLSRTSTYLWAQLWSRRCSSPVYTYFWTHTPPGPHADRDGAFHGGEIWYFLDSLLADPCRPFAADDQMIADRTSAYVARFIATGDPNGDAPPWPAATGGPPITMELGDAFDPMPVATPARFDLHRRMLESQPRR